MGKKRKKRIRPVVDSNSPLALDVRLHGSTTVQPSSAAFWRWMETIVARIPSYRNTQSGRQKASFAKFMFVVLAVGIALGSPPLWPLSLAVALFSYPLPVRHSKKSKWLEKARTEQAPREITCLDVGVLEFDGTKLSARRNKRVVESLRPNAEGCRFYVNEREGARSGTQSVGEIQKPVGVRSDAAFRTISSGPRAPLDKVFPIEMNGEELKMLALQFAVLAPLEPERNGPTAILPSEFSNGRSGRLRNRGFCRQNVHSPPISLVVYIIARFDRQSRFPESLIQNLNSNPSFPEKTSDTGCTFSGYLRFASAEPTVSV